MDPYPQIDEMVIWLKVQKTSANTSKGERRKRRDFPPQRGMTSASGTTKIWVPGACPVAPVGVATGKNYLQ